MNAPLRKIGRRAGGQPLALFLLALLIGPAQAQPDRAPSALELGGQPVPSLASHPDVTVLLRSVARGRQTYVLRHLRAPEPGTLSVAEGRYVFGWTCDGGECPEAGLFLGYDTRTERLYLLLLDEGVATLTVPTRRSPWPAPMAEAVLAVKPDLQHFHSE